MNLIRQAFAYQMEFARYRPKTTPRVKSVLQDFTCTVIPNKVLKTFSGHSGNVKCVEFVGERGEKIFSGSRYLDSHMLINSDNTCRLWNVNTAECLGVMKGHTGRIWDVSSEKNGCFSASASGDSTVKV